MLSEGRLGCGVLAGVWEKSGTATGQPTQAAGEQQG